MRHRRILPFALTALTLACASAGGGPESVSTASAPAAIGPYSQAVVSRGVLYAAGQLPLDPVTGQLVAGDVGVQTERALMNLAAVLASRGAGWSDVTKTTLYLQDLKDFARVNEVYARVLGSARPARSTVQVAALPRGALIEIDLVAVVR